MKEMPESSGAHRFALMLEIACQDFETLTKVIRKEIRVAAANRIDEVRAVPAIRMALAKSFIFHVVRARRICEHEASSLKVGRQERKRFLAGTSEVLHVRDVNEHGFDPRALGEGSRPSLHHHRANDAILDETSLVILGDQGILMGPLNLYAVYGPVDRMRQLAGFVALGPEEE